MPPKKALRKAPTANSTLTRRKFNRRNFGKTPLMVLVEQKINNYDNWDEEEIDDGMFASQHEKFKFAKPKKKIVKVIPTSPVVSDVEVSSDEEGAGQFNEPEQNKTDDAEIRKLNQMYDSLDDVSLPLFNKDGVRVKTDKNNRIIGVHENQPDENWRPGRKEELMGNFPPNKVKKKKKEKNQMKEVPLNNPKENVKKPVTKETLYEKLCKSIRKEVTMNTKRASQFAQRSFRVFGTPVKARILQVPPSVPVFETDQQIPEKVNRLSMFSYTPCRGNRIDMKSKNIRLSTMSDFSPKPQFASTPIEKQTTNRLFPFDIPEFSLTENDDGNQVQEVTLTVEKSDSTNLRTALDLTKSATEPCPSKSVHKDMEIHEMTQMEEDVVPSQVNEVVQEMEGTFRKAETSMTDILVDSDAEKIEAEEETYSKKRQRTKSPETMCHGQSTIMTVHETEETSNKGKRAALQPQIQQIQRESRLSVMTANSSRRESINSLMEDMSLDIDDLLVTMGDPLGDTRGSEMTATRGMTAMSIRRDNDSVHPFYLEDVSFDIETAPKMTQLLHVCGQKEVKTWNSLPKSVFDGRRVKKLGEGSYGEVFSTIWEGKPVALKVIPFESDPLERKYYGEYHSEKLQTVDEIFPEVIVLKQLSNLKNMMQESSTPNFVGLETAEIVRGNYPSGLLKAWDKFGQSENTRPDVYASEDQDFIVLVTELGGISLENFKVESEEELRSILIQLCLSMQAAEKMLEFEHRDLHVGNVLIDRNGVSELKYKINDHEVTMVSHGVKVNIIDFTLSRISKEGTTVFLDLEQDPSIFQGEGDPQFEVYRQMRALNKGLWHEFEPKTNVLWIEFLANRLIDPSPDGPGELLNKILTQQQKKKYKQLFAQLGKFENVGMSFTDPDFFNNFYEGYLADPESD